MDAKLRVVINLNNAAFGDDPAHESARILRKLANWIDGTALSIDDALTLFDFNGNKVGKMEIKEN